MCVVVDFVRRGPGAALEGDHLDEDRSVDDVVQHELEQRGQRLVRRQAQVLRKHLLHEEQARTVELHELAEHVEEHLEGCHTRYSHPLLAVPKIESAILPTARAHKAMGKARPFVSTDGPRKSPAPLACCRSVKET